MKLHSAQLLRLQNRENQTARPGPEDSIPRRNPQTTPSLAQAQIRSARRTRAPRQKHPLHMSPRRAAGQKHPLVLAIHWLALGTTVLGLGYFPNATPQPQRLSSVYLCLSVSPTPSTLPLPALRSHTRHTTPHRVRRPHSSPLPVCLPCCAPHPMLPPTRAVPSHSRI